jgi:hypothetical protein
VSGAMPGCAPASCKLLISKSENRATMATVATPIPIHVANMAYMLLKIALVRPPIAAPAPTTIRLDQGYKTYIDGRRDNRECGPFLSSNM